MQNPEPSGKIRNRPWLFGALFVWALTAAVAFTALSSKGSSTAPPASPASPAPGVPLPTSIQWEDSFEKAMQRARSEGRTVMVDFYTDWCGPCKILDRDIYTDSGVVAESTKLISVKVNAEKRQDLAQAYGITGYPTIAFLKSDGQPVKMEMGVPTPSMMVQWMQSARSQAPAA